MITKHVKSPKYTVGALRIRISLLRRYKQRRFYPEAIILAAPLPAFFYHTPLLVDTPTGEDFLPGVGACSPLPESELIRR